MRDQLTWTTAPMGGTIGAPDAVKVATDRDQHRRYHIDRRPGGAGFVLREFYIIGELFGESVDELQTVAQVFADNWIRLSVTQVSA